ncbi:hypothetical protein CRG98_012349 [Punica granatum]|uniref:Uncharacterized protein n=1 Tax=Punica granatum TaxID=22663 RepID=A0A2I0KFL6_PUNGR|nr:hypothetical protein CRG98_012349 [Punica granatum]
MCEARLIADRCVAERCASDHAVTLYVRKKLVMVSLAWEGGSTLGPRLALPWRKGASRRCLAHEGWQGWTASGHDASRHG